MKGITYIVFSLFSFTLFSRQIDTVVKPRIVIVITVDHMTSDYLNRYWDKFCEKGFKRLAQQGIYYKNARYPFLINQAVQGYATLSTGTTPSQHGIIAEKWYSSLKNKSIDCIEDEATVQINPYSIGRMPGYNAAQVLSTTLSDQLKLAFRFKSKVVGISLYPEGAVLTTGHNATAAYWMDDESASWVSGSFYMDSLPRWVKDFNAKKLADIYLNREWGTFLPIGEYTESLLDNNPYETGIGQQVTFPYNLISLKTRYKYRLLKTIPWGNTYTKDFALAAILNEKLGDDSICDYLSVVFSANQNIDKSFGPRSIEMEDTYLRLDQDLAHFLNYVEDYIGLKNALIVLTSSCGTIDEPSFLLDNKMPSGYFRPTQTMYLLKSYFHVTYGIKDVISLYYNKQIYFNQQAITTAKLSLTELQEKASEFLVQSSGIAFAVTGSAMRNNYYADGILASVQRMFNPSRSGDITLILEPGWVETNYIETIKSYDGFVPLFFYGKGLPSGIITRPVLITDIAPTLSYILNIPAPNAAIGSVLQEVIK